MSDPDFIKLAEVDRLIPGNLYKVFYLSHPDLEFKGDSRPVRHIDAIVEGIVTGRHIKTKYATHQEPVLKALKLKSSKRQLKKYGVTLRTVEPLDESNHNTVLGTIQPEEDVVMFLEYVEHRYTVLKLLWKDKVGIINANPNVCFVDV